VEQLTARFGTGPLPERLELVEELTEREIEILHKLAEGLGNRQIASSLAISEHTVKFHISSILDKLHASSRTEAVTIGIRMGVVLL
jgi:DNA-binding NarL/FixJ family response regulator